MTPSAPLFSVTFLRMKLAGVSKESKALGNCFPFRIMRSSCPFCLLHEESGRKKSHCTCLTLVFRLCWSSPQLLVLIPCALKRAGRRGRDPENKDLGYNQERDIETNCYLPQIHVEAVPIIILIGFGGRYVIKLIRVSSENINFQNQMKTL